MPPLDEKQQSVCHPVALLQDRRMHCGQTARLVVDVLQRLGIPLRVVQLKNHATSEFKANGKWILVDAGLLNCGEFLTKDKGLAGLDEVKQNPRVL